MSLNEFIGLVLQGGVEIHFLDGELKIEFL